jgi:hypothetical protein
MGHLSSIVAAAGLGSALALTAAGCMQISTGGEGDGGTAAASSDGGTAATDATSGSMGTNCGTDPQTGVVLCLGSSACPNLMVDTSAFPSCGFHQGGSSPLDLECLCNGTELCPIGVPTTCAEATQLLSQQQSALQVCQQVSNGGCLSLEDAGSGSGGGTTGLSAACQTCVSGCGSTPACYQSCGC